jgi:hypothetical protein
MECDSIKFGRNLMPPFYEGEIGGSSNFFFPRNVGNFLQDLVFIHMQLLACLTGFVTPPHYHILSHCSHYVFRLV